MLLGIISIVIIIIIADQLVYKYRSRNITGPRYVYPLIGKLWASMNPKFKGYLTQWNYGEISCTFVLQKFIVFANSNKLSRKVFNSPEEFVPTGVVSMRKIMMQENWVFLTGAEHLNYRKKLVPLFSRSALACYLPWLQKCYKKYTKQWLIDSDYGNTSIQMQSRVRAMNMKAALGSFCGNIYLEPNVG